MDERLLLTLENLADLQNEWRNALDLKRKTKRALEIVRMVFNFCELIQLKDEFIKEFENYIQSEYPSLPAPPVMVSIKNFFYVVSAEKAGNITVKLSLPDEDHDKKLDIADSNLFKLLRECERIVLELMEAHNEPKETESGEHRKIPLKFVEFFKKLMGDGESKSEHFEEKVEPFDDGTSPSLCGSNARDLPYDPLTSSNDKPKGEDREPTAHTEEIVGTKAGQPSSLIKRSTQNRIKVPVEELRTTNKVKLLGSSRDSFGVKKSMVTDHERISQGSVQEKVEFAGIPATNDSGNISTIPNEESETGSLSPAETTDSEDEESEGEDVADLEKLQQLRRQYKKANCEQYRKHKEHLLSIKPEEKNESSANIDPSDPLYVLTYDHAGANEIKHCSFKDKQEALQWAHETVYRKDKKNVFIKVWTLDEENSSSLNTNDLMIHKVELKHPVESTIVETRESMFDTGAEFASVSFNPAIAEKFLNSATKINGQLRHTFYAKLSIDGTELNEKIYEIDFDSDDNWCAFGLPQMADLDVRKAEETLGRIEKIILKKMKN